MQSLNYRVLSDNLLLKVICLIKSQTCVVGARIPTLTEIWKRFVGWNPFTFAFLLNQHGLLCIVSLLWHLLDDWQLHLLFKSEIAWFNFQYWMTLQLIFMAPFFANKWVLLLQLTCIATADKEWFGEHLWWIIVLEIIENHWFIS